MPSCAVIGLGQLGAAVARHLAENGAEVIAVDTNVTRVEAIKDYVSRALCMDATDERALRAAGIGECGTVVLALAEDHLEAAVLATMLLRELGVGRIISRAASDVQGKVLERLGVSRVIFPERQMGIQIARQILTPSVKELMPLSSGTALGEVEVPQGLIGRTIGEAELRGRFGLNVVGVKRRQEVVRDDGTVDVRWAIDNQPGPATRLGADDVLVVVGTDEGIQAFSEA